MKKEALIAIFLGVVFGVTVAGFIILQAQRSQLQKEQPISLGLHITPSPIANGDVQSLDISQPESGTITSQKSITIKGKVSKDALIVIQSPIKTLAVKSNTQDFSIEFPLAFGENAIRVSMYPNDHQLPSQEKELAIYYLDEQ